MSRREHSMPLPPALKPGEMLAPVGAADKAGYIRILPRTGAPPYVYQKSCETCKKTHDGTFGAGRFCSSRCARTVGGLAHRRKRQMERSMSTHAAAAAAAQPPKPKNSTKPPKSYSSSSKRSQTHARMMISALLNPSC